MADREELRKKTVELLQRLRVTSVDPLIWDLFEVLVARLDRLELGSFETEEERPTTPERKVSTAGMTAVRPLGERVDEIFREAKKP